MRTSFTRALAVAVAMLLAAACGGDDGGAEETQPVPDATVFEPGGFDDIPLHPGSDAVGERTDRDGATSQSFAVTGATPEQVLRFYEETLPPLGWLPLAGSDIEISERAARGQWVQDGERLVVSASNAPTLEDEGNEVVTQYSLSLGPQEQG